MMSTERVLFVDHTGQIGGAELILLDVVDGWRQSSVFLFENGPLGEAMAAKRLNLIRSKWGSGLSHFRRDSSPLAAIPLAARLCAIVVELARAARAHDVIDPGKIVARVQRQRAVDQDRVVIAHTLEQLA